MLTSRFVAGTLATAALCAALAVPSAAIAIFPPSATAPSAVAPAAAIVANGAWTVYHHDNAHTGFDSTQPTASTATTGWVTGTMDAQVYGEPLVYGGIVYAATLNNTVYAFNQVDGSTLWSTNLGAPTTSGWQCGNVAPLGILGTPVIDAAAGRIYVAALGSDHAYRVFGLGLISGAVVLTTLIPSGIGTGLDWTIEQQRGALGLANGYIYVPFGGRWGDCGPYHGWVVAVPTNGGAPLPPYETPSTGEGIWAAGGVAVDDATGNLFFSTGNAIPCGTAVNSDSVIRTTSTLGSPTFFQPADWNAHWCSTDTDLGSVSPVLISPSLLFTTGKYGQGFLLNPAALGGLNGQLFPASSPYTGADVCLGVHSDASFGSGSYANGRLYLTCENNGVVSLSVNTSTPSFSTCDASCTATGTWHTTGVGSVGPPIVVGGAVWAVDIGGGGLYGFNASTGAQIFHSAGFGVAHFATPSEAGGQIFVASDNVVRSFNMVSGCSTVTLSAAPPSSAATGTTVVLTAAASGANCTSPQYQYWMRPAAGGWAMLQDYSGANTYNWTSTAAAGAYYLSVHARALASPAPYESFTSIPYTLTAMPCTGVTASAAPPSPSMSGTPITITGSASGCPNPSYEFWYLGQGSSTWQLVKAYSTSTTYNWNSTGALAGTHLFSVWVRDASSSASYDAYGNTTYSITTPSCASATASAAPPSPMPAGTMVTITGVAGTCSNPSPLYQFWYLGQGSSTWQLVQGYSPTATYNWNSTGARAGSHVFSVWVRDAASPGLHSGLGSTYDAYGNTTYTITIPPPCTSVTASASPASPQASGTPVTITATASGCTNPRYEFWILAPGGSWMIAQAYSPSATFNWTTSGLPPGIYRYSVWVRDASGGAAYDAYFPGTTYTLT